VRAELQPFDPPDPAPSATFAPGASVPINVDLQEDDGQAITSAFVSATPNVPLVSWGDLLSAGLVTDADLAALPADIEGDTLSERERLGWALANVLGGDPVPRVDLPVIPLDSGAPGSFSAAFDHTATTGAYTFTVNAMALDFDCERYQREMVASFTVGDPIDPDATVVTVGTPSDGVVTVTVTPTVVGGGYVGPGSVSDLVIVGPGLTLRGPLVDNLDGTYTGSFDVATGSRSTDVDVEVRGQALPTVTFDAGAPRASMAGPTSGQNTGDTTVVVSVGQDRVGEVTGLSLLSSALGKELTLGGFTADTQAGTVQAVVPAGLDAGRYSLVLETAQGRGAEFVGGGFDVLGTGRDFPTYVDRLDGTVDDLVDGSTDARLLGKVVRNLRGVPFGAHYTETVMQAAVREAWDVIPDGGNLD